MKRLICLFMIGCGGNEPTGSGVEPTLAIGTLATTDIDTECDYASGLSRPVMCNDREVESVATRDACIDLLESIADTCETTVAELETCFEALAAQSDAEVCGLASPESCGFLGDPDCIDL